MSVRTMTNKETLDLATHNNKYEIIFTPKKVHLEKLAYRLTPEIKKYFADEQIQKEFAEWKQSQNST